MHKRVPPPLREGELERLWTDLGNKDWSTAIDAVDRLVQMPDEALALVKQGIQPISAAAAGQLLADLDPNAFAQRDRPRDLTGLEFAAKRALRDPSAEAKPGVTPAGGSSPQKPPRADYVTRTFDALESNNRSGTNRYASRP